MRPDVALRWEILYRYVNDRPALVGTVGVRDPDNVCEEFDGKGYQGDGRCDSDGHYICNECSHLAPDAPRFTQTREGRAGRLRLFWRRGLWAPGKAGS